MFLPILIAVTFVTIVTSYPYNDYPYNDYWTDAPDYPDDCCQLEWVNMTTGEELPKDWINAGKYLHRDFAFTRTGHHHDYPFMVGVKSSRKEDAPYGFGFEIPNPFPILTNPNKCTIGWYTTTKVGDTPKYTKETFFPTTGFTAVGSYAQFQGIPGWLWWNGDFWKMIAINNHRMVSEGGVKLLYVDCSKKSGPKNEFDLSNGIGGNF